jgi:adenylate kinase family enzyme
MTEADRTPALTKRWLIVGSGGSGKSTLARAMSEILGLPVIHLDRHFWRAGWDPTPRSEWSDRVVELSAADEWVMDGNYSGTISDRLPRAEAVILLDLPPLQCAWRVLKRRFLGAERTDIPADCPDHVDVEFLRWVLMYRRRSLPRVLARIAEHPHVELTTLRSNREITAFTRHLRTRLEQPAQ